MTGERCVYPISVRTVDDPAVVCGEPVAPGCGQFCAEHAEVAL
ncbi:MAG TPA: hypothetical protein VN088_07745 [Nocardioides sp.]|nr:hypothetical protein [Nocardioides sp.]